MAIQTIHVPDLGGADNVDVIEICVAVGDELAADDALVVVESDKASMDIPSPIAGKVVSIAVKEGDKVSEGAAIIELELGASESPAPVVEAPVASAPVVEASASAGGADLPVSVPDLGGADAVEVIELCVALGDSVEEGDSLIVVESDKASMDIPSPAAGTVLSISVSEGDKIGQGDAILVLNSGAAVAAPLAASVPVADTPVVNSSAPASELEVSVPDIGGSENVDVIEICVKAGDEVAEGDSLIVLESDKASMEVPAPSAGKVAKVLIKEGDKVSMGTAIVVMSVTGSSSALITEATPTAAPEKAPASAAHTRQRTVEQVAPEIKSAGSEVYAGPAARKLAREMAVNLTSVKGTGPRSRISKDDIKAFVKSVMQKPASAVTGGSGIPAVPEVDFSKFGEIELQKMSKIKKLTAVNMSRNWLNVPHVTQFDDADITELDVFRKSMKADAEKAGVKLTPLPFILKACAAALKAEPSFNVSLHADGEHIVQKKYVHIGMAVDTPIGLMVPVIRDVDKKGLFELAEEMVTLAKKAREGKLKPAEMQGGCFTISSLGPIGGTGFTPIVNAPEVAILGVSKASIQPVWDGQAFQPRQMLPLCLSYDHRAINGGDAGRFFTYLSAVLGDVRRLLL